MTCMKLGTSLLCMHMVHKHTQSSVGETDSQQASSVGTPHHFHRTHQEHDVQFLEARVCALCPRNRKVSSHISPKYYVDLFDCMKLCLSQAF